MIMLENIGFGNLIMENLNKMIEINTKTGSKYIVDMEKKLIKKISGEGTERLPTDVEFKSYDEIMYVDGSLLVIWGIVDGVAKTTFTSPVVGTADLSEEQQG